MECSCSVGMGFDSDGSCSGADREVRAAKDHKCYECGGMIRKGERYRYHTLFYDGTISNFKLCLACDALVRAFFQNGWIYGSIISDLDDYLYESWQEDLPSNCISKLPPAARDRVCDILQDFQVV
jgi:hypothetical protein